MRALLHHADDVAREPHEILAEPVAIVRHDPLVVVKGHQIDVARIIELAGAELAEAEQEEPRGAIGLVGVRHFEPAAGNGLPELMPHGKPERGGCEIAECLRYPLERPQAGDVGDGDGERRPPLGHAERGHDGVGRFVACVQPSQGSELACVALIDAALQ